MVQVHKLEVPKSVYFFERSDGSIIYTDEKDAWRIYSKKNQVLGSGVEKMKYIGVSSGKNFQEAVQQSHELFKKTNSIEASQKLLREIVKLELEEAKLNKTPPRNFDSIGNNGQPVNISLM